MLLVMIGILAVSQVVAAEDIAQDNSSDTEIVSVPQVEDSLSEDSGDESVALEEVDDSVVFEKNNENLLNSNPKNFIGLNEDINGNDNKEVYLKSDYCFNTYDDYSLHDGIHINRNVTIYGNNHKIDGINRAQIFYIADDVVAEFRDLVIVNGNSAEDAGAISGACYVINCTFIGNLAGDCGGAMFGGVAINSTFINNTANGCGGAIFGGHAVGCTFIGNKAVYAFNSYGGAMYCGYAEDCKFINNRASWGGAMYGDYDVVVGSIFEGNSATYSGGALYKYGAINSTFTKNHAGYNGGAMCDGAALNCTLRDNTADNLGNNTYETQFYNATLRASNFSSYYRSGEILKVKFTDDDDQKVINDGYVTAKVYKDNKLVGTYYFLSGSGWAVNLDAGSYVAVLSIDYQSYNVEPVNVSLNIDKASSRIFASSLEAVYNTDDSVVIAIKDSLNNPVVGAKVSVDLNGVKSYNTDKNGQIKISAGNLVPKNYPLKVTFDGDNNYMKSTFSSNLAVKKAYVKLTAKKKTFKAKVKTKKYTVTLMDNKGRAFKNAKLVLKIKGKTFKATANSKGKATFKIKKFTKKGKFNANIKFAGDKYFNALNKKVQITIKK